jgi:hypothetical protein
MPYNRYHFTSSHRLQFETLLELETVEGKWLSCDWVTQVREDRDNPFISLLFGFVTFFIIVIINFAFVS